MDEWDKRKLESIITLIKILDDIASKQLMGHIDIMTELQKVQYRDNRARLDEWIRAAEENG